MRVLTDNFGSGDIIKCGFAHRNYKFSSHLHQFSELVIVLEGEILVMVDGVNHCVHEGEAVFIPPFRTHSFRTEKSNRIWICAFTSSYIDGLVTESELLIGWNTFVFRPDEALMSYTVKKLPDYLESRVPKTRENTRFFKALLYPIIQEFLASASPSEKRYSANALSSILLYMNEHAKENITRESVGAALGFHPVYISRYIGALYNMNFRSLLNSFRIDHAISLLRKTDFKIIDIALECGFSGERSFYRAFISLTGRTPGDYRKGGDY